MKVHVVEELFAAPAVASDPLFLETLFTACLESGHSFWPTFDPQASPAFQAWRDGLSSRMRDAVDSKLNASQGTEARETGCIVVVGVGASDWSASPPRVGPQDIVTLLHAPLTILVEHEVHDGDFLRAVAIGDDGDYFRNQVGRGRIRFDNGGGSTMRTIIEARRHDPARAHRMWVVFDGDALVPNEPSSEARKKVSACEAAGVRHHMLRRRAIENYLPHSELDTAIAHEPKSLVQRKTVGAFGRLRPDQRAHYNLKKGFDGDLARLSAGGKDASSKADVDALFATVTAPDRGALGPGLGDDIARLFAPDVRTGRRGISERALRADGQEREMLPLFRDIVRSL